MLSTIGSKLRLEQTLVRDDQSNAGSASWVVTNVTNTDLSISGITNGVSKVLFYFPTLVYAEVNGQTVAIEKTKVDNVYWILKTSAAGTIFAFVRGRLLMLIQAKMFQEAVYTKYTVTGA